MSFDKSQFFQVFYEETAEHLATMEELLLALDVGAPDQEDLNAIFRAVHSIKGGAGTFGFKEMTDVAHVFESVLDRVRKSTLQTTTEMIDLFLETGDVLTAILACYQGEEAVSAEIGAEVCRQLNVYLSPAKEGASPVSSDQKQEAVSHEEGSKVEEDSKIEKASETEEDSEDDPGFGFFDDLPSLEAQDPPQNEPELVHDTKVSMEDEDPGFGFFDLETPNKLESSHENILENESHLPEINADPNSEAEHLRSLAEKEQSDRENKQGYGFFNQHRKSDEKGRREMDRMDLSSDPLEIQAGRRSPDKVSVSKKSPRVEPATSLRIDITKVDQLFNQVGEIVITQAMLAQMASKLDPVLYENIHESLAELERNTRDLQESVMAIRMVPCRVVFSRFPRLIRDMQKKFGKDIELILIGEETEVDKGFVEKLVDPLTHLVRNSFDHGIESAEDRAKSGKALKGAITLRASHQGGNVVIEVSDDGKGLDRDKILKKAQEKGIPTSETMTDTEVWQLIFAPGLSTTDKVSDLSGRGVGMDVVKKNVQAMGGVVDIESVKGQGSRIIIRLPLTLAIIEGMVIRVGVETYILPLIAIVESIRPNHADISKVLDKGELVNLRGEYVPVIRLSELFGIVSETRDLSQSVLVIVESEGGRVAIMVDELIGQQQVVIKSLEENFMKVSGIAGATILGDGQVAFIIDVRGLLRLSRHSEPVIA